MLAHIILGEKLHIFGIVGCVLCIVGSTTIVLHAPQEREIESVKELWDLATEPGIGFHAEKVMFIMDSNIPYVDQIYIYDKNIFAHLFQIH